LFQSHFRKADGWRGLNARGAIAGHGAARQSRRLRTIPELFGPLQPVIARIWRSYPSRPDLAQIPDVSGWRNAIVNCVPRHPKKRVL
jgi:hypothetical protein